jgi:hypothetical protein
MEGLERQGDERARRHQRIHSDAWPVARQSARRGVIRIEPNNAVVIIRNRHGERPAAFLCPLREEWYRNLENLNTSVVSLRQFANSPAGEVSHSISRAVSLQISHSEKRLEQTECSWPRCLDRRGKFARGKPAVRGGKSQRVESLANRLDVIGPQIPNGGTRGIWDSAVHTGQCVFIG